MSNFYKGIVKLEVTQNILFIFDNDTAGTNALESLNKIDKLPNIKLMLLPNLKFAENFPVVYRNKLSTRNINGFALTIECFLDLDESKNYIRINSSGNGKINSKSSLKKSFPKNFDKTYNYSNLKFLVQYIKNFWINNI
ncbi:hypothetical protein [Companilactobacillus tucceti]|nr:hypothetical protein [Companilactobacillus tucceti]